MRISTRLGGGGGGGGGGRVVSSQRVGRRDNFFSY